jgi:alpha-glucosidase (family GH31 glycosyl hydrolase)
MSVNSPFSQLAVGLSGRANDTVFFHRASSAQSPRHAALFWAGDQLVSWDAYDGLQSAILGYLSGGLSGLALTHSDVGGYTMVHKCVGTLCLTYNRSCELLMRWGEMSAVTDPLFRTHLGSGPSPYQVCP